MTSLPKVYRKIGTLENIININKKCWYLVTKIEKVNNNNKKQIRNKRTLMHIICFKELKGINGISIKKHILKNI